MKSKKENTHTALLRAALALFAAQGFDGTSTALIAKQAGVASGTLFFHFATKEELINQLFEEIKLKIENVLLENYQPSQPVHERFIQGFSALLRYFLVNPQHLQFMEQYHFSPLSTCALNDNYSNHVLKNILHEARETNAVKDIPVQVLHALAFGPIVSLAKEHATRGCTVDEAMIHATITACWDGMKT
jgi:AcrR family transcriptional regulator